MVFKTIREDIRTVFRKDPAAKNLVEVLFCYPGLHALWLHRIARLFYRMRLRTIARMVSHMGRHFTGIEIHPGARIGRRFFIDHGMGVVIGETAEIGDDVLIYQGVVLGGTSLAKKKRHPTIGNGVVIGTQAVVLGPITIGERARVGAGSVVLKDAPAGSTVIGIPGRIKRDFSPEEAKELDHGRLPDPIADAIEFILNKYESLEQRLVQIEDKEGIHKQISEVIEKKKKEIEDMFFGKAKQNFIDGDGI